VAAALTAVLMASPAAAQLSLQRALLSARDGDTIVVPAGVHRGQFVVNRRITLRGEGPASVLDGEGRGTVLTVVADSVTVAALRITGSGTSLDHDDSALRLQGCRGCVVRRLFVDKPLHGIYLADSHGATIIDNEVAGDSTVAEARRGNGIHLFNSNHALISGNRIHGTRDGIYFSFASGNRVDSNVVTGVRYGLHYMYSNDNRFDGNVFRRNAAGGALMFSDRIFLRGNVFSDHVGYRAYGLLLQTARYVVAEGNRFSGNLVGLFVDNSYDNTFRDNAIVNNGIGIDLLPSSRENTLHGNRIADNRTPVRIARGSGSSTWAVDGRGNYWGNRSVFDLDGDGVGDRPLRIGDAFATLAAARPALDLFSGTPAALALSWAEEALPVFSPLRVTDPAPLIDAAAPGSQSVPGAARRFLPSVTGIVLLLLMAAALVQSFRARAARRRGVNGSVL
jgi:nitrous oxidase accessory protein